MATETPGSSGRRRLGKYEVLAHIATGGMGAVYKARDTELNRDVALKILSPELAAKPNVRERFRREARSVIRLRHENIVAFYEFGEINEICYLALEFVEGVDLHHYVVGRGPLYPDEARDILTQTAQALHHAHTQGIVHRDVKPSNILVGRNHAGLLVKLTDMGLARAHRDEEYRVTKIGATVGTLDYMAPEQARDSGKADIRSDLYSLGCTLFYMLTGDCPFPNGTLADRVRQHAEVDPPDVRWLRPEVPADLAAVVHRLMRKQPEQRFQTPEELLTALGSEPPIPTLRLAPPAPAPVAPPPPKSTKSTLRVKPPSSATARATGSRADQPTPPKSSASRSDLPAPAPPAPRPRRRRRLAPAKMGWGLWVVIVGLLGAALMISVIVVLRMTSSAPPPETYAKHPLKKNRVPVNPKPVENVKKLEPVEQPLPRIFKSDTPPDRAALTKTFLGPFTEFPVPPPEAVTLHISRDGDEDFRTLAEAWAQMPEGKPVVIEIHDNGTVPASALTALTGRRIWLRAAQGFRPLLVWDGGGDPGQALFTLNQGELVLDGLDVLVKPAEAAKESVVLCRVTGGDFAARNCSFLSSGQPALTLAALQGTTRARLVRCFGRGTDLTAARVAGKSADVLFDGCLFFTTRAALLEVFGPEEAAVTLRAVRSTLVAGRTLLQVRPESKDQKGLPKLEWLGWDALLACNDEKARGDLVHLPNPEDVAKLNWHAVNCVYSGWNSDLLTAGPHSRVLAGAWPKAPVPEVVTPAFFNPLDTPVAFSASFGLLPVGCELDRVPRGRKK